MNWDVLFDFSPFAKESDKVLEAFWATIRLSATTGVLSLILGTLLVAMRVSPTPVLRAIGTFYVNTFRNTPLTLILVFCSLGLSDTLKINISDETSVNSFWLAVFGFSAYTAAFVCESLRAGINTVPLGQAEAARAIGLPFTQSLRLVILPQAFRASIAPLGSVLIAMIKNSTVVLVAGYIEAAAQMRQMFEDYGATLPIFLGFAAGFMVLTLPAGLLVSHLSKRLAVIR
ncbi:amino acid ABC transporter permease [Actinomadura macrotermitis]|uniref:Putative glutamine ABC transporter permease protein GlnM n=1 Tax=Actinomadura macrotermitis TaxID=2585200 RepID=A0A7K0BPI7_9ACTN|nr:amino acid ABC transporter permease [Actinomadura macrotermitis]MQY02782.1 putative glutamine ABC transporter permease protein GlnM [Actinomadura macrotermitis]